MNPIPVYFVPILLLFLLIKRLYRTPNPRKTQPPSPRKFPILGNFHQLGPLAHRSLKILAQKHGPVMSLQLGSVPTVVVSSSEAAREIMKNHDIIFADRPTTKVTKKLMYNNKSIAIAPYDEYWRQTKSIYVLQLLSNRRVESFHDVRVEEIALMIRKISDFSSLSKPINLSETLINLTNDVISRVAFGKRYGEGGSGQRFKHLLHEYLRLLGRFDSGYYFPWLGWINQVNGFYTEVEKVAKEIDEFLEGVLEERSHVLKNGESGEDFLDTMLRIYQDGSSGASIDRDSIKAIFLSTFSAGTDTSSTFLEWQMTELLRHPKVMIKVQNEVREILRGKTNITNEDIAQMRYLRATMKETFRLHPPIPLLVPRKARESAKIMGYDIDIGTTVIINAFAIGRDPNVWAEPEEFKPERFLDSKIEFKGNDFELIPFGAGRRGCPGISFATSVNELVIVNLVRNFNWELPGEELDMSEKPGVAVHRKVPLIAIANPVKTY